MWTINEDYFIKLYEAMSEESQHLESKKLNIGKPSPVGLFYLPITHFCALDP